MTDQDYCAIAVVMDRSGSMKYIQSDAEGALRSFVADQQKGPGRATLTLVTFDDTNETLLNMLPLDQVVPDDIVLEPRGMTALLDAIGDTIDSFGKRLAGLDDRHRPGKVLFVIVTDGVENASHRWRREQIFEAIKRQRDEWKWEFVFLAATEDAVATAISYGIPRRSVDFFVADAPGTQAMGQTVNSYTTAYRGGATGQSLRLENEDERVKATHAKAEPEPKNTN